MFDLEGPSIGPKMSFDLYSASKRLKVSSDSLRRPFEHLRGPSDGLRGFLMKSEWRVNVQNNNLRARPPLENNNDNKNKIIIIRPTATAAAAAGTGQPDRRLIIKIIVRRAKLRQLWRKLCIKTYMASCAEHGAFVFLTYSCLIAPRMHQSESIS